MKKIETLKQFTHRGGQVLQFKASRSALKGFTKLPSDAVSATRRLARWTITRAVA